MKLRLVDHIENIECENDIYLIFCSIQKYGCILF